MHSQTKKWGRALFGAPMILAALTSTSCDPKVYPDPDRDALAAWEESMRDAGELTATPSAPRGDESGPGKPVESGPGEPVESGPPVASIDPGGSVGGQSGGAGTSGTCSADAGACSPGDAGVGPTCVPTGPRDCSSELDNDCDGQPDNLVDAVCVCALGTSEACDEHPDLDGHGPCRAGLRTCVLGADRLTSGWGACVGPVGPGGPDSCTVRGDDADCDGTPNSDCPCVDGDTQECGSPTDTGPCAIGTSRCVNGRFGACEGAVAPAAQDTCSPGDDSNCNGRANDRFCACLDGAVDDCGVTDTGACVLGTRTCRNGSFGACGGNVDPRNRDCRSQQDNDCDGRPDNALDNVCTCSIGSIQGCLPHSQDGIGRCRAGTQTCVATNNNSSSTFNACNGSVGPAARDCRSAQDNDCDGRPDNTIDGVCECIPGQGNGPCSGDPNNSRCDAQGQCVPCQADADCSLVSGGRNTCVDEACVPDVVVVGNRVPLSTIAVTSANVFALSTSAGVIRLAKDGSSPTGGEVISPGSVALAGLSTSGNLVFWNTSTSLIRLGTDGVQSTFASVGISSSLGPVAAAAGNVYWGEQQTIQFTYVRSSATTNTLPAPRTVLRTVTLQDEIVEAIAGIGDCVFAVVSRNGSDRIDRVCSTQLNSSVYVASAQLGALAIDNSGLYFIEEGVGLRRLSPIDSTTPGTVTVAAGASRGFPSDDFVYFVQNGRSPAGTCGLNASIRRIAKTGGALEVIEPGPLSCPLGLAVDENFVYWSETAGSVKRSGKDAQ